MVYLQIGGLDMSKWGRDDGAATGAERRLVGSGATRDVTHEPTKGRRVTDLVAGILATDVLCVSGLANCCLFLAWRSICGGAQPPSITRKSTGGGQP